MSFLFSYFILNMGQFMSCEADLLHFDSLLLEELK